MSSRYLITLSTAVVIMSIIAVLMSVDKTVSKQLCERKGVVSHLIEVNTAGVLVQMQTGETYQMHHKRVRPGDTVCMQWLGQ